MNKRRDIVTCSGSGSETMIWRIETMRVRNFVCDQAKTLSRKYLRMLLAARGAAVDRTYIYQLSAVSDLRSEEFILPSCRLFEYST